MAAELKRDQTRFSKKCFVIDNKPLLEVRVLQQLVELTVIDNTKDVREMSENVSLIGSLWPVMIAVSVYQTYQYFSIKQEIIETALELNNTIDKDQEALIFNR